MECQNLKNTYTKIRVRSRMNTRTNISELEKYKNKLFRLKQRAIDKNELINCRHVWNDAKFG